ncbi:hypothetical protein DFH28DRAFT_539624 [Melampsora americana]|nr:hypothetical protein DFH28DRAFT_539624 [Melampsora americana]
MFGVASCDVPTSTQHEKELANYLSGKYGILPNEKPLDWRRKHQKHFSLLASMAWDSFSISATTCYVEQRFLSAADVAAPGQGSILSNTITHKVVC